MNTTDYRSDSRSDASQLYGTACAAPLRDLGTDLRLAAPAIVDEFYDRLARLSGRQPLLEALSAAELARLKQLQQGNLLALAATDLNETDHGTMAMRVGKVHAMVGLASEALVHSEDILHTAVHRHLDASRHGEALSILSRRLIRDVAWQIRAYEEMESSRHQVLLDITRLAWAAGSYTDLIGQAVGILGRHGEIAGCSIGRPDQHGRFRFEAASGTNIEPYLTYLEHSPASAIEADSGSRGRGPTGRAWLGRTIERCLNFATDARMAPWRDAAAQAGYRSSAAIPLHQPGCAPTAVLTLYCAYPGGFAGPHHEAFLTQLQALLTFALARFDLRTGLSVAIPYVTRQHWAALLRSDALEMHYQPLLDLRSGTVSKAEALARLRDGERLLAPGTFLPALSPEDFLELYARGLRQALAQRRHWLRHGFDLDLSLNLPFSGLGDRRYFEATRQLLSEQDCPGHKLTLEILETDDLPRGIDIGAELARFKTLGVRLAEDDLGSGHSSLTRLRNLPFDTIKIDRSLVAARADQPPGDSALHFIYQLTRLGHALGKSVIVEGVEDEDLLEAIAILGADAVQGYVVARPMSSGQLLEWLAGRQARLPASPPAPGSTLARLARLLVWEETLHLLLREAPERTADGGADAPPPGAAGAGPRHASLAGMAELLLAPAPPRARSRHLHQRMHDLLHAAWSHGPRSPAYAAARERLVSTLCAA
ncbi:hypothetical protein BKK79_22065 [Cupriavidus sp. USMAA2-4]|uniref:EAL domain-containing protein n=1 Tax=Cupriavidus malaysiensis TaxID=367825 RepID=A0ABN4TYJ5_9BURK|nr:MULTISPECIES: EAL domain-containing protein [Cupriavidus]AOY94614.1 hypothetical protein BKK79_22065 [Cupriavidus sp. USMAA2-4]AOZ10111.1 hypothetical protein BKK80_31175 [Cupriavidus malaysiensis]